MIRAFRPVLGIVLVLLMDGTVAQNREEGLSGQVAFGYLGTSGNSESKNMNLTFGGQYITDPWEHSLDGQAVRASANEVKTAESYGLTWQSRRNLSNEQNYVFGLAAWNRDEFSKYEQQVREVVGYGRRFLDGSAGHRFDAEVGAGWRQATLRDGMSEDGTILRLSGDYEWVISETATFNQILIAENGSDNTYTEWVSKLTSDIWSNIAIVLSYTIKQNSDVPVGTEKRDTFTAVSLEYSF